MFMPSFLRSFWISPPWHSVWQSGRAQCHLQTWRFPHPLSSPCHLWRYFIKPVPTLGTERPYCWFFHSEKPPLNIQSLPLTTFPQNPWQLHFFNNLMWNLSKVFWTSTKAPRARHLLTTYSSIRLVREHFYLKKPHCLFPDKLLCT